MTAASSEGNAPSEAQAKPVPSAKPDEGTPPSADQAPIWPDGYVVASEEEWIPVINNAGQKLEAARKAYGDGSSEKAATDLREAAGAIREDAKAAETDDKAKLEQSAKDLEAVAEKLTHGGGVERKDFEAVLVKAYRQDAPVSWVYSNNEVVRPLFERPSHHSLRALEALTKQDYAVAAEEIRRSTAYFRLAALSARDDDRELLQHEVDVLNARAKQAAEGKLTPDELRKTLAQVDAAYAESYLHQAEARYKSKDAQHATRSLSEAAARMRSRLHWVGKETERASLAVVDEVEGLAGKLGKGAKVAFKHVAVVFKHAHHQVKSEPAASAKTSADHG